MEAIWWKVNERFIVKTDKIASLCGINLILKSGHKLGLNSEEKSLLIKALSEYWENRPPGIYNLKKLYGLESQEPEDIKKEVECRVCSSKKILRIDSAQAECERCGFRSSESRFIVYY